MNLYKNYKFDSIYDFVNEAKKTPINKRHSSISTDKDKKESSQSKNINEALSIVENGHNLDTMNAAIDQIKTTEKTVMELEYSVAGMTPDVPEFLSGNPECMVSYNNVIDENKYIHIVVQINENFKITAEQMINRAISIASIINDLEVNGYRVKLSLVSVTKFKCGWIGTTICLKEYDQSIGLSEISGTLHPSFLRRVKFLWIEGQSWLKRHTNIDQGYGLPSHFEVLSQYCSENIDDKFIIVPSVTAIQNSDPTLYRKCEWFKSIKGAKEYVKHLVKQIKEL